jgi:hypothetical protein
MELTSTFVTLLSEFQCVFTKPTYATFVCLMTGWVLSHRRRFVTDLIWSAGCTRKGHHSKYHRFFSQSKWQLDTFSWVLAQVVFKIFVPTGLIELAVDDTLCRKRGLTLYGAGMHHDPLISSRAKPLVSWGHDWVVVTVLISGLSWAPSKVWALPLVFCLYRNRQGVTKGKKGKRPSRRKDHRTRPELAVQAISLLAQWFPDRQFLVSGDSAYGGKSALSKLPSNVDLISHVHPKGVLYEEAPAVAPGQKGRRRKKGRRLPGLQAWADDNSQKWRTLKFDQFGLHATLAVKTRQALYYKSGGTRLLTIVLVRDQLGQRPDQMFYCTRLDWTPRQILSAYSRRWAIEVTFENCKQLLGLEDPANRTPLAVQRTAPMALALYSLIVAWFHRVGHKLLQFPDRPWYTRKEEPSFADMLTTLRRESWRGYFSPVLSACRLAKKYFARLADFLCLAG